MIDEETLAQMNGKYVMPPDATPALREAYEYGFDRSLAEEALKKTPGERIDMHQRALDLALAMMEGHKQAAT